MSKRKQILTKILIISMFVVVGVSVFLLIKSCIPTPSYPIETLKGVVI